MVINTTLANHINTLKKIKKKKRKKKKHERSFSLVTPTVPLIATKNGKDELSFDTTLTPENFQTFVIHVIHMQWLRFLIIINFFSPL